MSDETKLPSLPPVTGIADPQIRSFLASVKEFLEVRDGRRGKELDRFVTLRELSDADVVALKRSSGPRGETVISPGAGGVDYSVPPVLLNLVASPGYAQIFLAWDQPTYANFAYAEIWRAETDVQGTAIYVGMTSAPMYSDSCGTDKAYYYWVRAVTKAGVTGPFNAVSGTFGQTSADVAYLLTQLEEQLSESQLTLSLQERLTDIDGPSGVLVSQGQDITELGAQYTVKIDNNGYVAGYGLANNALLPGGKPFADFAVVADRFSIAPVALPAFVPTTAYLRGARVTSQGATYEALLDTVNHPLTDTAYWKKISSPFFHLSVPTVINGATVPAGTYLGAAFIADATITNAKIADATIDSAKIANLNAAKITAGFISADRIDADTITADKVVVDTAFAAKLATIDTAYVNDANIGDYIQSTGYGTGAAGWRIDKGGDITSRGLPKTADPTSYDYTMMNSGDVTNFVWFPTVGHQPTESLTRIESGLIANGAEVELPGYWQSEPKILVSPASLTTYVAGAGSTSLNSQSIRTVGEVRRKNTIDIASPDYYKFLLKGTAYLDMASSSGLTIVTTNQSLFNINSGGTDNANAVRVSTSRSFPIDAGAAFSARFTLGGYLTGSWSGSNYDLHTLNLTISATCDGQVVASQTVTTPFTRLLTWYFLNMAQFTISGAATAGTVGSVKTLVLTVAYTSSNFVGEYSNSGTVAWSNKNVLVVTMDTLEMGGAAAGTALAQGTLNWIAIGR